MSISLTSQQLKTLSSAFIFKNVDEIMIEQLVADPRCTLEAYPRGGVIFDETHFCRSLGIVLSGEILVEKTTKVSMSRLFPGNSSAPRRCSMTAAATSPCSPQKSPRRCFISRRRS